MPIWLNKVNTSLCRYPAAPGGIPPTQKSRADTSPCHISDQWSSPFSLQIPFCPGLLPSSLLSTPLLQLRIITTLRTRPVVIRLSASPHEKAQHRQTENSTLQLFYVELASFLRITFLGRADEIFFRLFIPAPTVFVIGLKSPLFPSRQLPI